MEQRDGFKAEADGGVSVVVSADRFVPAPTRREAPATGGWPAGLLLLANEGLNSIAFVGVEANLVLFCSRVMKQPNAAAANTFSRWMGTTHLFSLAGAVIGDAVLGLYRTCVVFQAVFIAGLITLSLTTCMILLKPKGCGKVGSPCDPHSPLETAMFYLSIYLVALGNGGYEPSLATFGSNQFDDDKPTSSSSFYGYFYVATNLGSLFAETVLAYIQNLGHWTAGFWVCTACASAAYALLLSGRTRYRDTAAATATGSDGGGDGSLFLRRKAGSPWLPPGAGKKMVQLLPIWVCTIFFPVIVVQMISLFIEQGAAMRTSIGGAFHMPPASMTVFDIVLVSIFILLYDKLIAPAYSRLTNRPAAADSPSDLEKMGIGLAIGGVGMVIAGVVERWRRLHRASSSLEKKELSSLSIMWQVPQYVVIGVSEAFLYVGQLEFFTSQAPEGMKGVGVGLCYLSGFLGSYLCSFLLAAVVRVTARGGAAPGWVPPNLNDGHLDKYFFLTAGAAVAVLLVYAWCARRYRGSSMEVGAAENTLAVS